MKQNNHTIELKESRLFIAFFILALFFLLLLIGDFFYSLLGAVDFSIAPLNHKILFANLYIMLGFGIVLLIFEIVYLSIKLISPSKILLSTDGLYYAKNKFIKWKEVLAIGYRLKIKNPPNTLIKIIWFVLLFGARRTFFALIQVLRAYVLLNNDAVQTGIICVTLKNRNSVLLHIDEALCKCEGSSVLNILNRYKDIITESWKIREEYRIYFLDRNIENLSYLNNLKELNTNKSR